MADLTDIAEALAAEQPRRAKASRDQFGVIALDAEGAPTVKLDGGEDYAPCTCMVGVHHGDRVMAHVVDHRLVVFANVTAPTTDDATALVAIDKADVAAEAADAAGKAAASAQSSAEAAADAASDAQTSADQAADAAAAADGKAVDAAEAAAKAQGSADEAADAAAEADKKAVAAGKAAQAAQADATRANTYSNAALGQLGVVQDVAGILTWASEQGAFVRTSDTAIVDGKVYFTFDGTDYTPVVEPDAAQLSTYYELDMSGSKQAMNEYILAHLAVTSRGLWVLPSGKGSAVDEQHAAGYKMLLASDGSYLYDSAGVLVRSDTASGTDFASSRDWHVGGDEAYILYDASEGTITIGGSSIQLGSTKTLSELMAEVDGTVVFKVTEEYSQDRTTATLTAHVYKGGLDTASQYDDLCFAWYRKSEAAGEPLTPLPAPYTNGRVVQVARSTVGYGAAIVCRFEPPNDAGLLTGDDDSLTTQDGEPLTARTPSGDYVRVADLTVETVVFDTDKVMLVGSEDEHLVSIATLKETFGAEVNQNAFSNVKVGSTTVAADAKTDTLELAGSNVTLTPDATNDKVTIGINATNVTTALGNTAVARATADASGNNIASTYATKSELGSATAGALQYKGTAAKESDISGQAYKKGWYYVVSTAGTYFGKVCEVGDMLIAKQDKTSTPANDWDAVQSNVEVLSNAEIDTLWEAA